MTPAQLVAAYLLGYNRLTARTVQAVIAAWLALDSYDEENVEPFLARVVPVVTAAQSTTASTVDAYVARLAGLAPVGIPQMRDLRGVPSTEVYRRPFVTTWTQLRDGVEWGQAVDAGRARLETIASTDVQLAQRAAMDHLEETGRIQGYRRVIGGKACKFCATASTQRYTKSNLQPIHAHCDCGVAPIFADSDPGSVVNRKLLDRLKDEGAEYWKSRGFVDDNGEPVDPTSLPRDAAPEVETHGELGSVFAATT